MTFEMSYNPTFGLPRYVLAILHLMEAHKECMKWTVSERSHKLSLTLTWDFRCRQDKAKKSLWGKLQSTLKDKVGGGGKSNTIACTDSAVPRNLVRFIKHLEMETRDDERELQASGSTSRMSFKQYQHQQQQQQHQHQQQQQQFWSRCSLQSLPVRMHSASHMQLARSNEEQLAYQQRQHHMKSFSSYHNLPSREIVSPFHASWPGASFDVSSDQAEDSCTPTDVIVVASGGAGCSMDDGRRGNGGSGGNGSGGSGGGAVGNGNHQEASSSCSVGRAEDIDGDSEANDSSTATMGAQIVAPLSAGVTRRPRSVNDSMTSWRNRPPEPPRDDWTSSSAARFIFNSSGSSRDSTAAAMAPTVAMSTMTSEPDSDSASEISSDEETDRQTVNQTVIRCLDSCDKILFRHSTTIT